MRQNRNRQQLGLPLEATAGELTEEELRVALRRAGLQLPLEKAMDNPALAICLKNSALSLRRGVTRR